MMDALPPMDYPTTPVTVECVVKAAEVNGVPLLAMKGVLAVEGGWPGLASKNRNGSYDLGPMQINTIWREDFARRGIPLSFLRTDGCGNVMAGAWILGRHLRETGDTWKAVARYHSKTPEKQLTYLKKILKALERGVKLKTLVRRMNKRMEREESLAKAITDREKVAASRLNGGGVGSDRGREREARRSGLVALDGRGGEPRGMVMGSNRVAAGGREDG